MYPIFLKNPSKVEKSQSEFLTRTAIQVRNLTQRKVGFQVYLFSELRNESLTAKGANLHIVDFWNSKNVFFFKLPVEFLNSWIVIRGAYANEGDSNIGAGGGEGVLRSFVGVVSKMFAYYSTNLVLSNTINNRVVTLTPSTLTQSFSFLPKRCPQTNIVPIPRVKFD